LIKKRKKHLNPIQALLCTAYAFSTSYFQQWADVLPFYEPVVTGTVIGAIMGNMATGLVVGGTLELAFVGLVWVGAALPPDATVGTIAATILVIETGIEPLAALGIAWTVAVLVTHSNVLFAMVGISYAMPIADRYAAEGNTSGLTLVHFLAGAGWGLGRAVPTAIFTFLGMPVITSVINYVPELVWNAIKAGGVVLGAVGIAGLLNTLWRPRLWPLYVLGFAFAAFLGVSFIGLAVIAFALSAALVYGTKRREG